MTDVPPRPRSLADLFVQPSIIEGFGLPVLEATHFGRPLLVRDLPVDLDLESLRCREPGPKRAARGPSTRGGECRASAP